MAILTLCSPDGPNRSGGAFLDYLLLMPSCQFYWWRSRT